MKKAEKRHLEIRDMLLKKEIININEFSKTLGVSIATVRNDLTYLEKQGFLKRVLGGAISNEGTPRNTVYTSRINLYKNEKMRIAKYVVDKYVRPNTIIALDAGTTCYYIAKYLLENDVYCEVLTNSFSIISLLSKTDNIRIRSAGGVLDKEHNAFYDKDALSYLSEQEADLYFLAPNGIDEEFKITSNAKQENKIKDILIEISRKTVVVADHSKVDKKANYHLSDISMIEEIVSDKGISDKVKEKYNHPKITFV